jgi:hypothetical protein
MDISAEQSTAAVKLTTHPWVAVHVAHSLEE